MAKLSNTPKQALNFDLERRKSYAFQVQACNADGVWNLAGARFAFTLPRRLTEYGWFQAGAGAALLGLVALAWVARDRRRRREIAEIRHRELLQMQMIESSPVPMVMLDRAHRVLYVNATFTRVLGFTAAEIPDLETWWRLAATDPATRDDCAVGWSRRIAEAAFRSCTDAGARPAAYRSCW